MLLDRRGALFCQAGEHVAFEGVVIDVAVGVGHRSQYSARVRWNWNAAHQRGGYVVAAAAFGPFGFRAAFPVAFAVRIVAHLFFDASLMALRPAALSFHFGFSGTASVSFAAAHRFF